MSSDKTTQSIEITSQSVLCSRCKESTSITVSRKESFCSPCFIRFITGKQRKLMSSEKFKIKFAKNESKRDHVLFPCSFGKSSVVLLDILLSLMQEQEVNPRGQVGFEMTVLFLNDNDFESYENSIEKIIGSVKTKYNVERLPVKFQIVNMETFFQDQGNLKRISVDLDYKSLATQPSKLETNYTIKKLLQILPNRASRHDLLQVIKSQLIQDHVISTNNLINNKDTTNPITTVLYAHNMTTMANEVLALTVKGRGGEIHKLLTDGEYPIECSANKQDKIEIIHPLRDIIITEIQTYLQLRDLQSFTLLPNHSSATLMNKQKTINEVVNEYYQAVDTDLTGNIVSTVVSTGGKLGNPAMKKSTTTDSTDKELKPEFCVICHTQIINTPQNWLRDISYTSKLSAQTDLELQSFKEWQNSISTTEENTLTGNIEGEDVKLCYGCIVTIGGVKSDGDGVLWPNSNTGMIKERYNTEDVLKEFILD